MICKWMLRRSGVDIKKLSHDTGISDTIISILCNRGIKNKNDILKFMNPELEHLYNPMIMKDMDKGTDILIDAINNKKKIVIYGDYDCDGIVSTYILYSAVKECGGDVIYHIPDRVSEGYGINSDSVKKLNDEGIEVIVTCDNGISAINQIQFAKDLGMTVIVTDHHDIPFVENDEGERVHVVPNADAVINPKQTDCSYPFKLLCGAGVAFKFIQVLYEKMAIGKEKANKFIEYACIATICDVVDLIDENRIIAQKGLNMINDTKNIGLQALIKETTLDDKKINSYHIGFILGPCINATGRLESATLALELLLSKDEDKAKNLAKKLHDLNTERQNLTIESVNSIVDMVESSSLKDDKVLIVYKKDVHESIAGIVAGKLRERYNVPSIVLTQAESSPKGSGRSIDEYNMFEELIKCKDLIDKFGGHPLAAGLSIKEENIDKLREVLNRNCVLTEDDIIPKIRIDKQLSLRNVTMGFVEQLEKLEPFGKGNSSPIFAEKNIEVFKIYIMGKDKNVVKFFCRIGNTFDKIDAICFQGVDKLKKMVENKYGIERFNDIINGNKVNLKMDFIFSPSINEYNGNVNIQLMVKDFRLSNI